MTQHTKQVDDLREITLAKINEGVAQSCCILLVLNDETLQSTWCQHELQCARDLSLPIICLVDTDRQPARPLIDKYMEQGWGWIFDSQIINCAWFLPCQVQRAF